MKKNKRWLIKFEGERNKRGAFTLYESREGNLELVAVSRIEGIEHDRQTVGLISEREYRKLARWGIREVTKEDIRIRTDRLGDPLLDIYR